MGWRVKKQSNGLYSIWSTIVDDYIFTDLTQEDYIEIEVEKARVKAEGYIKGVK